MNIQKYFQDVFEAKCIITEHALKRIQSRFMASELSQLKLLIEASLKHTPLKKWEKGECTVLIDSRFNFSIVCEYYSEENIIKIITFIRGKQEAAYKNCKTINVSILKEKAEQEVLALNKKNIDKKIYHIS